ncbi:hypothetical protein SAY86_011857 [Trapa natans]|uniref:Nitrate regulatory gene2 protein n=1 Tax=Trapa natans TaxID=22666 RepID=A0AAN7RCB8_TRANT|nr:hypothetical protein SAY86_011857 [Trapa natans]
MGCASSKVDDLPAVALCRDRCAILDEAVRQRYSLADAHVAYIGSLSRIAESLHGFFELTQSAPAQFPPILNLPPHRKGSDPATSAPPEAPKGLGGGSGGGGGGGGHGHSRSSSGSHIQLSTDSEDESGPESFSFHHSGHACPGNIRGGHVQYMNHGQTEKNMVSSYQGGFSHMNYMKKTTTPSVLYEQRPPMSSQGTIQFGESSSSYYPYPIQSANLHPPYGYPNYGEDVGGDGGYGYFSSNQQSYGGYGYGYPSQSPGTAMEPYTKPPPPPPSPPKVSTFDFLNLFGTESYGVYYSPYTPGRNSVDVRMEEGIPDLEEERFQHEVVKEVHGKQKLVDTESYPKSGDVDVGVGRKPEAQAFKGGPVPGAENSGREYEVHVVDKKVVNDDAQDRRPEDQGGNAGRSRGFRGIYDAVSKIKIQFERAAESGEGVAKMLEAGKRPYRRRHQVTSKIVHVVTTHPVVSSKASTSSSADPSSSSEVSWPAYVEEEVGMRSGNLSSTLNKLYLWERKLYSEVKSEENTRVKHERKIKKLKLMDQRGAEATKVDATRISIRDLSTKIRMAIQVVDKISITVSNIRDGELWPQLNELIQGFTQMWKCMLECHRSQCQAIGEAGGLGHLLSAKKFSDTHLNATLHFERQLINWTLRFSSWISVQKGFVNAINNWLFKCLSYEPEETADGIPPFSPSRMGAPPVFVICNQWVQALERISEREVLNAMRVFVMDLLHIWKQDKLEMRQRMEANKDLEKKVKDLDREDQKIHKEVQAMDKRTILFAGDGDDLPVAGPAIYASDTLIDLQASLRRIFEAMERFMDSSAKAYEDLLQRCVEEERLAQGGRTGS